METKILVDEMIKKEGVQNIQVKPYEKIELLVNNKKQVLDINEGPACILIIYD